jgi:hypothetical protein
MKFFIDHIQTYSSVNKKGKELQSFVCEHFENCLVADESLLEDIVNTIKQTMDSLQKDYPRTKPFEFKRYTNDQGGQFSVMPENHYDDNCVFILSYKKVARYYPTH